MGLAGKRKIAKRAPGSSNCLCKLIKVQNVKRVRGAGLSMILLDSLCLCRLSLARGCGRAVCRFLPPPDRSAGPCRDINPYILPASSSPQPGSRARLHCCRCVLDRNSVAGGLWVPLGAAASKGWTEQGLDTVSGLLCVLDVGPASLVSVLVGNTACNCIPRPLWARDQSVFHSVIFSSRVSSQGKHASSASKAFLTTFPSLPRLSESRDWEAALGRGLGWAPPLAGGARGPEAQAAFRPPVPSTLCGDTGRSSRYLVSRADQKSECKYLFHWKFWF